MKKLLPFVVVIMMVGLSTWGHAQWKGRLPGMHILRFKSGVPVPLTNPRPIVPAFHYPPGVGPTMTSMPLPTTNPSSDVDHSQYRTKQQSELVSPAPRFLMTPTPATPRNCQMVPAFSLKSQDVVPGKFVSISMKRGKPFVTPHIIQEEYEEEPIGEMTQKTPPAKVEPVQIVGPLTTPREPFNSIPVESDPFTIILDQDEIEPVAVDMFESEAIDSDDFNPFGSEAESDLFENIFD